MKIQSWKAKLLWHAGRDTLIKFVIPVISSYAISAGKLPHQWCRDVDKMAGRFLWTCGVTKRKFLSPISWNIICSWFVYP